MYIQFQYILINLDSMIHTYTITLKMFTCNFSSKYSNTNSNSDTHTKEYIKINKLKRMFFFHYPGSPISCGWFGNNEQHLQPIYTTTTKKSQPFKISPKNNYPNCLDSVVVSLDSIFYLPFWLYRSTLQQ